MCPRLCPHFYRVCKGHHGIPSYNGLALIFVDQWFFSSWWVGVKQRTGGRGGNRTRDGGFADLCLTTWPPCRHNEKGPGGPLSWSGKPGSNRRPQPWQGCALPTELFPQSLQLRHVPQQASRCQAHPQLNHRQNPISSHSQYSVKSHHP